MKDQKRETQDKQPLEEEWKKKFEASENLIRDDTCIPK
jgi:hypothetical protein